MATRCWILLGVIAILASVQGQNKLKVSVYYEALCSDSTSFFTSQLKKAYPIIGDYITLDFIPYGKAYHRNQNGRWWFNCHHGSNECYANQFQACALNQEVPQTAKVNFLICLMSPSKRYSITNPSVIESCARENGVSPEAIFSCMRGDLKDTLLAQYGDRTWAVNPSITFVPTIIFNDVYDSYRQDDSLYDFLGTVCEKLPQPPAQCTPKKMRTFWWF